MTASLATKQRVIPIGNSRESWIVLSLVVAIISILLAYISTLGRSEREEQLHSWQISSFQSFEGADQAIYNALFTVADEIPYIYDDLNFFNLPGDLYSWPTIDDFQNYLLPPFYKDSSWRQNGELEWSLFEPLAEGEMQGFSMYLGTNGKKENQGTFLLTISHIHAGFTNNNPTFIWWHKDNSREMPRSGFQDTLIKNGWMLVIPHSGQKELERINGDAFE